MGDITMGVEEEVPEVIEIRVLDRLETTGPTSEGG
jgi:hypothetical protein